MAKRRVVVTGLGIVSPIGCGWKEAWKNLCAGKSGIVGLTSGEFDGLPARVGGRVQGFRPQEWLQPGDERKMAMFSQFAMGAGGEAIRDAGLDTVDATTAAAAAATDLNKFGVCCGSGIGSIEDIAKGALALEQGGYRKISPMMVPRLLVNMAAGHLSMRYGLRGPNHSPSTACTTGLHAIGDASRFIQYGDADVMLAGGTEACIHPLAVAGFARAKSLATSFNDEPARASRPFDARREGFVIGEGAGIVVLEEMEHAKRRNAKIYAEVLGYGLSGDAHHITAPPPDGAGAALAMQRALGNANISPDTVQYVNAHATSTPQGDVAEYRAIQSVIKGDKVLISSTKGATGHLLGAAGSVEAIFTILALHTGQIPPTLNLEEPDPEFGSNIVSTFSDSQKPRDIQIALTNSFGFGGTNASICFKRV